MASSIAADLREAVEAKRGPENGTVVVFEYAFDLEPKPKKREYYTFSAVYIEARNSWFLSGYGNGLSREYQHDSLMLLLASPNVKSASVATKFEAFKP